MRTNKYDYHLFTSKPKSPILPPLVGNALAVIAFVAFVLEVWWILNL